MKTRTKRILMLLFLAAGIMWDCLCLRSVLPLSLFPVSAVAISGYSILIIFVPLFFPGSAQAREKSTYIHDLTKQEKQISYATICLAFIWMVSVISCIV